MAAIQSKISRREAKEQSRKRLVNATIQVLHDGGPAALTTGRIAAAAGLSQPSFYVHFKDMDDALGAAAHQIGEQLRDTLREERRKIAVERSRETLHEAYLSTLNAFLAHPTFTAVVLRYRRDTTTAVGRYCAELVGALKDDTLRDCRAFGLDESEFLQFPLLIELLNGMTLTMVEGLLDGRFRDRDECAEVLLRATVSLAFALRS